jgi:hypothetical protein
MTYIPKKMLDDLANPRIEELRVLQDKAKEEYEARLAELDGEAADLVDVCEHPVVLVDEDDHEIRVCAKCGAYHDSGHEDLDDADDRATIMVGLEEVLRIKKFYLADEKLVR